MEGKRPAYYTDEAHTTVYRSGNIDIENSWVDWNAGYRLPTEAEWEKAARGGLNGKRFPWGDTIDRSQANYFSRWVRNVWPVSPPGFFKTYAYDLSEEPGHHPTYHEGGISYINSSPGRAFPPNNYGVYDTAGNVWEWCWDWYGYYGEEAQSDPRGPETFSLPGSGSQPIRVRRGAWWGSNASVCRVAHRSGIRPHDVSDGFGFRSVLPLAE